MPNCAETPQERRLQMRRVAKAQQIGDPSVSAAEVAALLHTPSPTLSVPLELRRRRLAQLIALGERWRSDWPRRECIKSGRLLSLM